MKAQIIQLVLFLVLIWNTSVQGKLTNRPQDQHVTSGISTTYFNCSSDVSGSAVNWKHAYIGAVNPHDVYKNGKLLNGYKDDGRYSVEFPSGGQNNLVIRNVQMHDAGRFICIDAGGNGEEASGYLQVDDGLEDLPVVPHDTVVTAANEVRLTCSSSSKSTQSVWWKHKPVGSQIESDVYIGFIGFRNGYLASRRYSIDSDKPKQFDLIIKNVQPNDAGTFTCIDDDGLGKSAKAELVVLDSMPECRSNVSSDGVLAENSCGMDPDHIQVSCGVRYKGHIQPKLEWFSGGYDIKRMNQVNTDSTLNSSFVLPASSAIKWKNLVCQVGFENSMSFGCALSNVQMKILPIASSVPYKIRHPDKVSCLVSTTENCKFSWVREDNINETVAYGQSWNVTQPGKYKCKANCIVRRKECTVFPMMVEYDVEPTSVKQYSWVLVGVVVVLFLIIMACINFFIIYRKPIIKNICPNWPTNKAQLTANIFERWDIKSLTIYQDNIYVIYKKEKSTDCDSALIPLLCVHG